MNFFSSKRKDSDSAKDVTAVLPSYSTFRNRRSHLAFAYTPSCWVWAQNRSVSCAYRVHLLQIKEAEIAKMSVEERAHLDKMMNDPTTKVCALISPRVMHPAGSCAVARPIQTRPHMKQPSKTKNVAGRDGQKVGHA
jgi:hypothetical protein